MSESTGQPDWFKEFQQANQARKGSATESTSARPAPAAEKGTDRRKHTRFEVEDTPVSCYREGLLTFVGLGKDNKAKTAIDLSEGGIQLVAHERFAIGQKVKIRLEFEKFKDVLETTGTVRWCYQKKDDFHLGVQFPAMGPVDARKIAAMRDFMKSDQYKAMRETRKRMRPDGIDLKFPT